MKTHQLVAALVLGFTFTPSMLQAQMIDFETLPDGTPTTGGMVISNQYSQPPFGVSFQFENGSYPVIRKVGGFNSSTGKPTAFWGWPNNTGHNTPAPGQSIGTNFLTDDDTIKAYPPPLIVTYSQPVSAASGFILDIDHSEAWDVYARNAATQVVAQVHLEHNTPLTGDGIATPWFFNRVSADIYSIRIEYSGDTNGDVGLAFDNFSPATNLPPPARAQLSIKPVATKINLSITGTPLAVYSIEAAASLDSTNWSPVTSVVLPSSSFTLTNVESVIAPQRFYRALGVD